MTRPTDNVGEFMTFNIPGGAWNNLKKTGNPLYKCGEVEPIDLYRSSGMLRPFCLCSIIKYAHRGTKKEGDELKKDMIKIIHYAQFILADLEEK